MIPILKNMIKFIGDLKQMIKKFQNKSLLWTKKPKIKSWQ